MLSKLSLTAETSLWLLPVCLLLGAAVAYLLYNNRKHRDNIPIIFRRILFVLRTMSISIIAFFLLSPVINSRSPEIEKPIVIIGIDNSESVKHLSDSNDLVSIAESMSVLNNKIEKQFDVHTYLFGETVRPAQEYSVNYSDRLTDISEFLKDMDDRYENRNTALLLLCSDGLFNKGQNPVYTQSSFQFPVYSLALGDTATIRDVGIDKVNHNKLAFFGNTFEVEIEVNASLLKGRSTVLQIQKSGVIYSEQRLSFHQDEEKQTVTAELEADEVGMQRFEVDVVGFDDEVSKGNNRKLFFIDVLENQQKVLILSSAPHPDVKALKESINGGKNYLAESSLYKDFNGTFDEFSLVILHGLPAGNNEKLIPIFNSEVPVMFILSRNTTIDAFNKLNAGLSLKNFNGQYNNTLGRYNSSFPYFSNEKELEDIVQYPPLICPFATYQFEGESQSLLFQQIGKVQTPFPLISFSELNNKKTGIISGEGMWRWRLFDYIKNGDTKMFDGLIRKFVQYLSSKEDKSRFRVFSEPAYFENMNLIMEAEYYNKSYELRNDHIVSFELSDENSDVYSYEFLNTGKKYRIDLGKLSVGAYTWKAKLDDGFEVFSKSGTFRIMPLQLEKNRLQADHQLLVNLSGNRGGKMLYPNELGDFADEVLSSVEFRPLLHYNERFKDLITLKTIFFILLILFTAEWSIRKYFGIS